MKKTFVILISTFFSLALCAQNENDALRYSLINYGGTARFAGLSGAYGAVGADFTSLSQNPAGIALYRKSEFTITPVLSANNTTSNYLNQSNNNARTTAYLGNVGYVYSQNLKGQAGPLMQLQFGFGINQLAKFSNYMTVSGFNNSNSLLNTYVDEANNTTGAFSKDLDAFGAGLAYKVNLIFYDSTNMRWAADMENGGLEQTKTVETRGSTNETVLSAGANISDKLFLGITFAFPYIRYEETANYSEKDKTDLNSYFNSFNRYEYLSTRGSGFNFKAGFIYMPVEFLRIGGAIHTPTNFYNMSDSYHTTMSSSFTGEQYSDKSPDGYFEYELKTPFRAMANIAVILGKYGLISADYEYIDYSSAILRAPDYSFSSENNAIRSQYTTANNLRLGAEIKAGIVAFRGGYSFYGTPFRDSGTTGDRNGYSFGIGVRDKGYFVDFSYNHSKSEANYYLYNTAPVSKNQIQTNAYSLSVGFRF